MPTERRVKQEWFDDCTERGGGEADEDFVGRDVAFQLGWFSGASAAGIGVGLDARCLSIIAETQYEKTCRSISLDKEQFVAGWKDGFKANCVPVIEVLIVISERSLQHGNSTEA